MDSVSARIFEHNPLEMGASLQQRIGKKLDRNMLLLQETVLRRWLGHGGMRPSEVRAFSPC